MNIVIKQRLGRAAILSLGLALPVAVFGLWLMRLFPYHPGFTAIAGWFLAFPAGMTAASFKGIPYPVAWVFGTLAEAAAIFIFLMGWVFLTRNREVTPRSPRRWAIFACVLLAASAFSVYILSGYLEEMRPPLSSPEKFAPGQIKEAKNKLPRGMSIDFNQLAFARGSLFVASRLGLIEVKGAKVSMVYRWHAHSRIDGVWSGPGGQSLWLQQAVSSDLSTLSDAGWKNVELPRPERGYTRGDMLQGIKIASTGKDLWLAGGSSLWRWNADKFAWDPVLVPGMKSPYESIEVHGAGDQPIILRGANELFGSDRSIALLKRALDGTWTEFKIDECCVKDLSTVGDIPYFRNKEGKFFRVFSGKLEPIEAPGKVEAIASMANRQVLASIADKGIFSFDGEWKKLFDAPYPSTSEEPWVYLAAQGTTVALSVAVPSDSNSQPSKSGLWVSDGTKMIRVDVPD